MASNIPGWRRGPTVLSRDVFFTDQRSGSIPSSRATLEDLPDISLKMSRFYASSSSSNRKSSPTCFTGSSSSITPSSSSHSKGSDLTSSSGSCGPSDRDLHSSSGVQHVGPSASTSLTSRRSLMKCRLSQPSLPQSHSLPHHSYPHHPLVQKDAYKSLEKPAEERREWELKNVEEESQGGEDPQRSLQIHTTTFTLITHRTLYGKRALSADELRTPSQEEIEAVKDPEGFVRRCKETSHPEERKSEHGQWGKTKLICLHSEGSRAEERVGTRGERQAPLISPEVGDRLSYRLQQHQQLLVGGYVAEEGRKRCS